MRLLYWTNFSGIIELYTYSNAFGLENVVGVQDPSEDGTYDVDDTLVNVIQNAQGNTEYRVQLSNGTNNYVRVTNGAVPNADDLERDDIVLP